ncbi:MAG: hypothetical protein PHU71_05810, partial [Candidatus Gracilibacteria bacterium]|nr:hypothetical protein [Candidatus Gracilibacteria bacterium]
IGSEDLYTISEPGEDGGVTYTNYAVGLSIDLPSMPKEYAEELARQGNEHFKIIMPLSDSEDFFVNFETYDVRPESSARSLDPITEWKYYPDIADGPVSSYKLRDDLNENLEVFEVYFHNKDMKGNPQIKGPFFAFQRKNLGGIERTTVFVMNVNHGEDHSDGVAMIERIISSIKFTGSEDLYTISEPDEDGWRTYTNNSLRFTMNIPQMPKEPMHKELPVSAGRPYFKYLLPDLNFEFPEHELRFKIPGSYSLECVLEKRCEIYVEEVVRHYKIREDLRGESNLDVYEAYFNYFEEDTRKNIEVGPFFLFKRNIIDLGYKIFQIDFLPRTKEVLPEEVAITERMISSIKFFK